MDKDILKQIIRRIPFGEGFPRLTKAETEVYIDELERYRIRANPAYFSENGKQYLAKISILYPSPENTAKLERILKP
jgi:hypothetical protein